jgi:hypothetical protein
VTVTRTTEGIAGQGRLQNRRPSEAEQTFSRRLVGLILGIDAVYRGLLPADGHGLAQEGWVAVNLSHTVPTPIDTYRQGRDAVKDLWTQLTALDLPPDRLQYFTDYLTAIDVFCRWQNHDRLDFGDLTESLLGVPRTPPDLAALQASLEQRLLEAGFRGELPDMVNAFRDSRTVPAGQVVDRLLRYMSEARDWVHDRLFPLPDDFQFDAKGETGVAYDAYCGFVDRYIAVNLDIQFTEEELKHLACHEAYPGHSTHILRREMLVRQGAMTEDGLLVVTDTPTNTLFEGVGEIGLKLLGWDRTEAEQINLLLIQLLHGVSAWAGYLFALGQRDDGMELLNRYWDPAWAGSRRELLDLPLRRPFIFTYFYGGQIVESAHKMTPDENTFLTCLYDRMHSPMSLLLACAARDETAPK